MFLVSAQKYSDRLNICRECKHYNEVTKSCGTLGIGKTVVHEGKKTKLCGCIMPVKAKLKVGSCPIDKWTAEISNKDIQEIQLLLNGVGNRIDKSINKRLTELWNKTAGGNRKVSTCNSCVKKMIQELRTLIAQTE